MNLEESDIFKEKIEKNARHKKSLILSIIICILLIILFTILIIYIKYEDSRTLKLFIDKTQVSIPNNLYIDNDGRKYLNLTVMADLLGYEYNKGEYEEYNLNDDSCYIKNDFEVVAITCGENKYDKYIIMSGGEQINDTSVTTKLENGYSEEFAIDEPAELIEGNIYVSEEYISKMFNLSVKWQEYRIYFYTLNYQVANAQKDIVKYNYEQLSGDYENLRAIVDGLAIVGNNSNGFGVIQLSDGKELVTTKYSAIKYIQNTGEFYVTTENKTMGLLDSSGEVIIPPTDYENISLLDEVNQLYLVEKDGEYGVLNRNGEIVIYPENDAIGYDVSNYNAEMENELLWFDKAIPVQKNGKFGLYNKSGEDEILLPVNYEGFGYLSPEAKSSGNQQSVLIIPESVGIEGIVIKYNDLYGIYDINEERIILTCVFSKIYSITKSGETTYYAEYNGEELNLKEYIEELGLNNVSSKKTSSKENKKTENVEAEDVDLEDNDSIEED